MAKIVVDAGHGGSDPGASGNGLVEKQWVLEVALMLAAILRGLGHQVKLTRSNDTFVGLSERARIANRWGVDIFISIHFNAGGGADAKGWEDFIYSLTNNPATKLFQNHIHKAILPVLSKYGMKNRGKKAKNFAVLRETRMPAILVEGGFVDSTDHNILRQSNYKRDMAEGIANGVQSYFGLRPVSSVVKTGWIKNKTGWWYKNKDGSYPKGEWKHISKQWYLFDSNGYMLTGWQKSKDKWYYMNAHGHMQKGWLKLGDTWYYLNASGEMVTGWYMPSDKWYYLNPNGSMAISWKKVDGEWYYLNSSGAMQTGLIEVNGKHYYLERGGALITGESIELEANKHGHLK